MKFKDILIGMTFKIKNEDDDNFEIGEVVDIQYVNGNITLKFDNYSETFTFGKPNGNIPNFLTHIK
jgi:hypothetical protein